MLTSLEVIQLSQIVKQSDTRYTVTCVDPTNLICFLPDGSNRPAQVGDVLSVQPDGSLQTRPAGTNGPYELAVVDGSAVVYNPRGVAGPAFKLPMAASVPNPS